jgi:predicted GNAT superfamily acetyltransferase
MDDFQISLITDPTELSVIAELQEAVWGIEDVVPAHMVIALIQNGGVAMLAQVGDRPVGFVFGFPGQQTALDGNPQLMHYSHMLAVIPEFRNAGLGFQLKRAQWQWVRRQGYELITWTYDPLLSANAKLNVARLGAICRQYHRDYYGQMEDALNRGLPTDRFRAEVWVNSLRVTDRMHRKPRKQLDLAHYLSGGAEILNPTTINSAGLPVPAEAPWLGGEIAARLGTEPEAKAFYLLEIPADFQAMRSADPELAARWRMHSRPLFEDLFSRSYLVTDFIHLTGREPRSFYVLSHGERTLGL